MEASPSKKYDEIIVNIDDSNKQCIDCQSDLVTHVSINNGIILCESCALKHQASFPKSISYIRKMNDEWDEYLFNHLIFGSNTKFIKHLQAFSIDLTMPFEEKYHTNACEYYRKALMHKIHGKPSPEPLDEAIAKETCETIPAQCEFDDYRIKSKERKTTMGKVTGFFGSMGKKIGKSAWEEMKKAGNFVAEKTAPATEKLKQGANYVSDKVAPATEKLKQGAQFVTTHAKNAYADVKGMINKKNKDNENNNDNEQPAIEVKINDEEDIIQQEYDQEDSNQDSKKDNDIEKIDNITEDITNTPTDKTGEEIKADDKPEDKPQESLAEKIESKGEKAEDKKEDS